MPADTGNEQPIKASISSVTDILEGNASIEDAAANRAKQPDPDTDADNPKEDAVDEEKDKEDADGDTLEPDEEKDDDKPSEETDTEDDTVEVDPTQLAEMFGLNEGDVDVVDDKLKVKIKVDGKVEMIPLERIRENYQLRKHIEGKSTALKSEREQFQAEQKGKREELDGIHKHLTATIESDMNQIVDEYQQIDWKALKKTNPAEYAAEHTDFQNRYQIIQNKHTAIDQQIKKLAEDTKAEYDKGMEDYIKQETKAIMEALPHWADEKTAKEESTAIRQFALDGGFSEDEISRMIDHRIWTTMRKAWLFDKGVTNSQGKSKRDISKKRTVKVARVSKGGVRNPGSTVSKRNHDKNKEVALQSRGMDGKIPYVSDLINQ